MDSPAASPNRGGDAALAQHLDVIAEKLEEADSVIDLAAGFIEGFCPAPW
jgi:hypothetical protein